MVITWAFICHYIYVISFFFLFPNKHCVPNFFCTDHVFFLNKFTVSYGVIPVPEVTEWQSLSDNDTYVVAATDGVFEKLSAQDICDIIWASQKGIKEIPNGNAQSLADPIVNRAFEMGSMDNMAAVVVPLQSDGTPSTLVSEDIDLEGDASFTLSNTQKQPYGSGSVPFHDGLSNNSDSSGYDFSASRRDDMHRLRIYSNSSWNTAYG
ncbi:putative protein phosphatase 2C 76 [Nymphaea thermarum]|nr:putative protein phosphatase 2C 76 [Nymphaea thermarum]